MLKGKVMYETKKNTILDWILFFEKGLIRNQFM